MKVVAAKTDCCFSRIRTIKEGYIPCRQVKLASELEVDVAGTYCNEGLKGSCSCCKNIYGVHRCITYYVYFGVKHKLINST